MDKCIPQKFEARVGSATIGAAFLLNSFFMAIPNKTIMYQAMLRGGIVEWIGWGLALGGAMTLFGSMHPHRRVRQWGQCLCFAMGWWILLAAISFDIIPATPATLAFLGSGLFLLLIRDVFAGVAYRHDRRLGSDRRHATQGA